MTATDMNTINKSAHTESTALCQVPTSATITVITAITATKTTPTTVHGILLNFTLSNVFFIMLLTVIANKCEHSPPCIFKIPAYPPYQ
jgi:hypothetical protein